jgi:hypothetical protein
VAESSGFRSGKAGILPLLAAALLLSACAGNKYMGILLSPGAAHPELQRLANLAGTGDKRAQLELAGRFEVGQGVTRDLVIAKKLCNLAAKNSGGTVWAYSPPIRAGELGRVLPLYGGPTRLGLGEAVECIERLK